jgi:hypothetical protein
MARIAGHGRASQQRAVGRKRSLASRASKQQAAGQAACSKSVDPRISVSAYWAGGSLSVPINPDFSYRGASDEPVTYTPRSLRNQCGL